MAFLTRARARMCVCSVMAMHPMGMGRYHALGRGTTAHASSHAASAHQSASSAAVRTPPPGTLSARPPATPASSSAQPSGQCGSAILPAGGGKFATPIRDAMYLYLPAPPEANGYYLISEPKVRICHFQERTYS